MMPTTYSLRIGDEVYVYVRGRLVMKRATVATVPCTCPECQQPHRLRFSFNFRVRPELVI